MTTNRLLATPRLALGIALAVILGLLLLAFTELGLRVPTRAADALSIMPQKEFERRIHAYLLYHPEVIAEALPRLDERERAAQAGAAKIALKERAEELLRDPQSPVGANPKGDVTLVEFFDYNCPYCRQVAPHMVKVEADDPNLRLIYKEFPILGASSSFAAKAALAAHRQSKYVAFHNALMETKGTLTETGVLDAARRVGLDVERLKTDMADPAIQATIDRNLALARALSINGTPGFVIGEKIAPGAVDLATMERLIHEAREKK